MHREYLADIFFRNMSHLIKPFLYNIHWQKVPYDNAPDYYEKTVHVILSLVGQFSFARNPLYMARSLIFFAQTTRNVRSFALPKTIRVILGKLLKIERTQRAVYFQLRAIFYTLGQCHITNANQPSYGGCNICGSRMKSASQPTTGCPTGLNQVKGVL